MAKKSVYYAAFFLFLIPVLLPATGLAQDGKGALRVWGEVSPFISGDAGSGQGAPAYTDAFGTGIGGGGEFSWRFCRWFSGVGGLGYEVYDGDTYEGFSFTDLKVVPVYAGGKFHFIADTTRWDVYARADIGTAYLSSVDISYQSLKGRYWDSSWVFFFDFGGGMEYCWGAWGASLEVKLRYLGAPDSALGKSSESDALWTVPITVGLNYHF